MVASVNGLLPIMWQIELIDQVTWCSAAMRTRPAQNSPGSAPHQDQLISPPSAAGAARVSTDQPRSQPMWACQKPRASAAAEVPYSQGECGSPSLSAKAWWRRWSATQVMIEAWNAIEPAIASPIRNARLALYARWVNRRWKPAVIPRAPSR